MTRRTLRLAPLALAALAGLAGCQDYNFSPVNQCLIQPGSERVTLSDISTADILFVVDDSGSMGGEQKSLADSFGAFVSNLQTTNQTRVLNGLEPIDFHIAVTTTSVFLNQPVAGGPTCQANCGGAAGQVCCNTGSRPLLATKACRVDADCTGAGGPWTCKDLKQQFAPEKACANAAGDTLEEPVACPVLGQPCGELQRRFAYRHGPRSCANNGDCRSGDTCRTTCASAPPGGGKYCCNGTDAIDQLQCNPGVSTGEYTLYPRGDFVKAADAMAPVGAKPRVIHFSKDLFCNRTADGSACVCTGAGAPATCDPPVVNLAELLKLSNWFKANVAVGTCGSSQEQGLEAARRAIKKALKLDGLTQPADVLPGEWPHPKSKLVVVWVGDEDDCSSPEDASQGVLFSPTVDTCEDDGKLPPAERKRFALSDFSSFFAGLDRPLASGFIVSATGTPPPPGTNANDCVDVSCQPNLCVDLSCTSGPGLCGGQASGYRYLELAKTFADKGSDMVAGSICAQATASTPPDFSSILDRVAEVVKQPTGLSLPTQPAAAGLTILRIVGTDGKTRKTCSAPGPAGTSGAALNDYDWWFIDPADKTDPTGQKPTGASKAIHINRTVLRCTANPGETYSADYLGLVPVEGCDTVTDCEAALGVRKAPWICQKEPGAPAGSRGTCLCGG
jgi:hypothetical protein